VSPFSTIFNNICLTVYSEDIAMPYREIVCNNCGGSGKSQLLDPSGTGKLSCTVCKGTGKRKEWQWFDNESQIKETQPVHEAKPKKEEARSVYQVLEESVLKVDKLMKWITSDAKYTVILNALQRSDIGVSDLVPLLVRGLELNEQQAVVVAEALLDSACDVNATIAMKRMLVGTYSHGDFKMGGGYSSSSVIEFQFKADFSYCFQYSYFSGYVSPAYAPVQMSYSSTPDKPDKTEKRGHYLLGKSDFQRSETDVVICFQDGSLQKPHVKIAGSDSYIGHRQVKKYY
jgi:hypothetical protein